MSEGNELPGAELERRLEEICVRASDRKLRLFACACAWCIWHLLRDRRCRRAVEIGERFADGAASVEDLVAAAQVIEESLDLWPAPSPQELWATWETGHIARVAAGAARVRRAALSIPLAAVDREAPRAALVAVQCVHDALGVTGRGQALRLLEDIFGPFSHPVPQLQAEVLAWRDHLAVRVAREIYDDRTFERLPILADALLDAGCDNDDLMAHCRRREEHVRGCWALDMLLGKS